MQFIIPFCPKVLSSHHVINRIIRQKEIHLQFDESINRTFFHHRRDDRSTRTTSRVWIMRICVDLPLLSERTHRNCYSVCQSFLFLNKGQELELVAEKSMNGVVYKNREKNFFFLFLDDRKIDKILWYAGIFGIICFVFAFNWGMFGKSKWRKQEIYLEFFYIV